MPKPVRLIPRGLLSHGWPIATDNLFMGRLVRRISADHILERHLGIWLFREAPLGNCSPVTDNPQITIRTRIIQIRNVVATVSPVVGVDCTVAANP
jgi:hypothetical protein